MSNQEDAEALGEELFIEELGDVRGGASLVPGKRTTLARGLGEEGPQLPRPRPVQPKYPLPGKPPVWTTMALGEEGTSVPPSIFPMSDE